ncbi:MAG: DUF4488 domain-containing protein [Bacteroidota bacterium]
MKLKITLFSLFIALILSSFIIKQEGTPLDGTWELKEYNYGGNKGSNPSPRNVKMFADGKFGFYLLSPNGARKTTDGTFMVLDSNYYTETIVDAVNKPMIGKTYKIKYQIKDSLLIMGGTYDSPSGVVSYSEIWVKVNPKIIASLGKPSGLMNN